MKQERRANCSSEVTRQAGRDGTVQAGRGVGFMRDLRLTNLCIIRISHRDWSILGPSKKVC